MSLAPPASDPANGAASPVLLSKTCQNCFSLKIRCDRTQRSDICDRCARLGKHCVFRPARRRDNSAKRDSRIQALEQQVQDLLRSQKPGPIAQHPLPPENNAPAASALPSAIPVPIEDIIDENVVTLDKADTLVEMYKSDMMPHFPFVIIPRHITGRDLRHTKSFLFLAILSVACFNDFHTQEKLCNRFKRMVSEKVLLGGDDCLQLEYLQGLLIVLAWNQYHGQSKFHSQYKHLAISIAVDMRLDRKPIRQKPSNPGSKRDPITGTIHTPAWGPEEQRAAAGIFYISSTIAKLLDKMNTFPCTQFIEEGCLALRQKAEHRTDQDLYHVIRLQRIIENIDKIATSSGSEADTQASYLRVRSELEEFRVYLCSDVTDSHLLYMQFHTAKLFLYQVAFFERNLQHSPAIHLNILCEGLESAKSFLDLYLWLPPKSEMALTYAKWIQLSFGVTLAAKFAIVSKDPGVEPQTRELRHRLDIDNIFRHLSLRIGALVGRTGDDNKQKDVFFHYELRVRKIQNWYERMCKATGSDSPMSQQTGLQASAAVTPNQRLPQAQPQQSRSSSTIPSPGISSQVPLAPNFAHQQPHTQSQQLSYSNGPIPPPPNPMAHAAPMATVGMTPLSSYAPYTPVPSIAFPDLMNAPGWDMPFTVPMENDAWVFDPSQGYGGMNVSSTPSDTGTWDSPGSL